MNLKIDYLDHKIEFLNASINVLEIQNKKYFYRIVKNFYQLSKDGYVDEFSFFNEEDKEISLNGKIQVFLNYFDFSFDSKKIINDLTKYINENIDENDKNSLNNQYKKIVKIYESILNEIELPISVDDELNFDAFIKLAKFKLDDKDDLLDNLLLAIEMEQLLNKSSLLVFVNLKQYLTKEELNELYKHSIYHNIHIILIDSQCYGTCCEYERKLIIDENLDEFMI